MHTSRFTRCTCTLHDLLAAQAHFTIYTDLNSLTGMEFSEVAGPDIIALSYTHKHTHTHTHTHTHKHTHTGMEFAKAAGADINARQHV